MRTLRQVNIKKRLDYFFNSTPNNKNFDPSLLSTDQYHLKKVRTALFITLNISKILIVQILLILFLIMQMHTLKKIMRINT